MVASLVAEPGLQSVWASVVVTHGHVTLKYFTFIKRLFSSSSLSAIKGGVICIFTFLNDVCIMFVRMQVVNYLNQILYTTFLCSIFTVFEFNILKVKRILKEKVLCKI